MPSSVNKTQLSILYRTKIEEKEAKQLYRNAALSSHHQRKESIEEDYRLPYKRDVDRIVHSKAYARYSDKTQVVYLVDNDHISHRNLHVQLVSSYARGIAEILRLNVDLVEAIALGHDAGHPPFGHEGEGYLNALSKEYGNGVFAHPLQSCHLFSAIEPLNLGLAVYDGFLCHDGGMEKPRLIPRFGKTWQHHLEDKNEKLRNENVNLMPMTLEGCLVKICDTISYLARDIEDAISLGILKREKIPPTSLGNSSHSILNTLANSMIERSYEKDYIEIGEEAFEGLKILRKFNFDHIYMHPSLKTKSHQIKMSYRILFETLLNDWNKSGEASYLWKQFLHNKSSEYQKSTSSLQKVVDYISGMTDNYFIRTLEKLIIPKKIELV